MALTKTLLVVITLSHTFDSTLESLDKDTSDDSWRNTAGVVLDDVLPHGLVVGFSVDEAIECL
jgi:hypothetical protein